jgi:hypothetical protein
MFLVHPTIPREVMEDMAEIVHEIVTAATR